MPHNSYELRFIVCEWYSKLIACSGCRMVPCGHLLWFLALSLSQSVSLLNHFCLRALCICHAYLIFSHVVQVHRTAPRLPAGAATPSACALAARWCARPPSPPTSASTACPFPHAPPPGRMQHSWLVYRKKQATSMASWQSTACSLAWRSRCVS